jgi:putative phosphoesterase
MVKGGLIGVISDTHGLVRDAALAALDGSDLILHAGDVGGPDVLARLQAVAPVIAVRGNVDHGAWADGLAAIESVSVHGGMICLLHNIAARETDSRGRFDAVVFGHSHHPCNKTRDGVLYFNPASAGPRRFRLPVAVGRLRWRDGQFHGEVITLTS